MNVYVNVFMVLAYMTGVVLGIVTLCKGFKKPKKSPNIDHDNWDNTHLNEYHNHLVKKYPILQKHRNTYNQTVESHKHTHKSHCIDVPPLQPPIDTFSKHIPLIMYINLDRSPDRRKDMETEFQRVGVPEATTIQRFKAVEKKNGELGCFLSHVGVLNSVLDKDTNVLVLEDDFEFRYMAKEIGEHVEHVDRVTKGRWDVIVLGQYVHAWQPLVNKDDVQTSQQIFRLLHSTTTSGFLVNKNYVRRLFLLWSEAVKNLLNSKRFKPGQQIDQIQTLYQKVDMWFGFRHPLGTQRTGKSLIGNVECSNNWSCSLDYKHWYDSYGVEHPLKTFDTINIQSIAVCMVATGKYIQYVEKTQKECVQNFLAPHHLEFFLFTDQTDKTQPACDQFTVHKYKIDRKGFPGDTLYRYHYMDLAREKLNHFDYIIYMDVDYAVYNRPCYTDFIVDRGLIATKHLHNLHEKVNSKGLIGSPETNPESSACIPKGKKMQAYYAGGVQGGRASEFLEAITALKAQIDADDRKGIVAVWHDESHWNRYLVDHPPSEINQNHIYPEHCIVESGKEPQQNANCTSLHNNEYYPVMVPLDKNHNEIRS